MYPWTWEVLWHFFQQCQASAEHAAVLEQLADGPLLSMLSLAVACLELWIVMVVSLPWEGGQRHLGQRPHLAHCPASTLSRVWQRQTEAAS